MSSTQISKPLLNKAINYLAEAEQEASQANYAVSSQLVQKAIVLFYQMKNWDKLAEAYNIMGVNEACLGCDNKGLRFFEKVLNLSVEQLATNHIERSSALNNIGACYRQKQLYNEALDYYHQALALIKRTKVDTEESRVLIYNNIGYTYFAKGDIERALAYYTKAYETIEEYQNIEALNASLTYILNSLGNCYTIKGDYTQALHFYHESLELCKQYQKSNHPDIAVAYNNIAGALWEQEKYQEALAHYEEALGIWQKKLGKTHRHIVIATVNIGYCHLYLHNYSKAMIFFKKVWSIKSQQAPLEVAKAHYYLGDAHFFQKKYTPANEHYEKSLTQALSVMNAHHPNQVNRYIKIARSYLKLNKFEEAIHHFHQVLRCVVTGFTTANVYENPKLSAKPKQSALPFLEALSGKGQAFYQLYQHKTQKSKDLNMAFSTYKMAHQVSQQIQQSYLAEGSKLTLSERKQAICNATIPICLAFSHSKTATLAIEARQYAFTASEQSKATVLLSSLKDSEAKTAANIPTELLEKEKQLKIELNYLNNSIAKQEAKGEQKDEELLSKFQSQHFDYKQEYDELIEQFEADYPEYYRLKYAVETASVEEVQNYLSLNNETIEPYSHKTILISYHIAPKTIYIFAITATTYHIHPIEKPDNFAHILENFQDAITLADISDYIDNAGTLFDLLLKPVLESTQVIDKLLIIPHNELTTLTFDALIDTRKLTAESRADMMASRDFSVLPYLIKDFDMSYHYSATMLLHSVARQESAAPQPASFIGFAPVSFDGSDDTELALASNRGQTKVLRSNRAGETALSKLPSTENEVKEVFNLFEAQELEAKAFLYASANKQNLFENAQHHKYVLIATHGYAQGGNAGLSGIYLAPQIEARGQKPEVREEEGQGSEVRSQEKEKMVDKKVQPNNEQLTTSNSKIVSTETIEPYSNKTVEQNNYILHTSEAYHLSLNAELVVLSSCSSGVGKLVTGEGMMAMNRGFLYAGASNIIFTYFDIPDQSSGELVRLLFKHILEGDSYAAALRKAKIALLSQVHKTPEDWAGYALIGK